MEHDGYLRLDGDELAGLPFAHLISGLDEDSPAPAGEGAIATDITGYTEWVTHDTPGATLGWDWQMQARRGQVSLLRIGPPRSNLMLVDQQRRDLGHDGSQTQLQSFIDQAEWVADALSHIRQRYRPGRS